MQFSYSRKRRSSTAVVLIKEIALSALEYLVTFFWERKKNKEIDEKTKYLHEEIFRSKIHYVVSQVREELLENFKNLIEELLHRNRIHESLYTTGDKLLRPRSIIF